MKVDVEGNVYCGGSGGLWVLDSSGNHLGTIVHGAPATTNLAFGGGDWKTLFFTTRNTLGRVRTNFLECRSRRRPRVPLGKPGRFMTSRVMGYSAKI